MEDLISIAKQRYDPLEKYKTFKNIKHFQPRTFTRKLGKKNIVKFIEVYKIMHELYDNESAQNLLKWEDVSLRSENIGHY